MEEHTFYDEDDILVSSTRFVYENETFAMSQISSFVLEKGKRIIPKAPLVLGALIFLIGVGIDQRVSYIAGIGLIIFIGALLAWMLQNVSHSITVVTSSGRKIIIVSDDEEYLEKINNALNDAVIFRG